jgi:hypothetical protein
MGSNIEKNQGPTFSCYCTFNSSQSNFESEYLDEFETEFENILIMNQWPRWVRLMETLVQLSL